MVGLGVAWRVAGLKKALNEGSIADATNSWGLSTLGWMVLRTSCPFKRLGSVVRSRWEVRRQKDLRFWSLNRRQRQTPPQPKREKGPFQPYLILLWSMDDASVVSRQVKARQPRRRDRLDARGHRPRLAPKGCKGISEAQVWAKREHRRGGPWMSRVLVCFAI